jgi:hypothetical protein
MKRGSFIGSSGIIADRDDGVKLLVSDTEDKPFY